MIGYITVGVGDLARGKGFWGALLEPLGAGMLMETERVVYFSKGADQPALAICLPYDQQAPHPGNGNMLAFKVDSREEVDRHYARALELGGADTGPPGERMPIFYGAYFRDPDGNKAAFYALGNPDDA